MGIFGLTIWNKESLMEYINVYVCSKKHNLTMADELKEPRDVVPAQWNIRAMLTKERSCAAGTEQTRWINIICFYSSFQPTYISLGQLLKGGFAELPPPWFSIVNCWALTAEEDESFTAQRGRCDVEQVRGDPGHQESPVNRKVMGFALPAAVFLRPLAGETQGVPLG